MGTGLKVPVPIVPPLLLGGALWGPGLLSLKLSLKRLSPGPHSAPITTVNSKGGKAYMK